MRPTSSLAVIAVLGCSRASPEDRTPATKPVPVAIRLVADAAMPLDAAPPGDAANRVATCGDGWRTVTSTLWQLTANEATATLCSFSFWPDRKTLTMKESPRRCARVELATGVFSEVPGVAPAAAPRAAVIDGLKVCKGSACVVLDVPPKDAAALAELDPSIDLDATGSHALLVLPAEKAVGVFDTATGKRIRTLAVTTSGAGCAGSAFFIGELIYASARKCSEPELDVHAWLFVGERRRATKPLHAGETTPTQLAGDLWAVASLKPYRVDFIHGATGVVQWSVRLPANDYDPLGEQCCLALGVTAQGTLMNDVSPLARAGAGSAIVAASPQAITWIDPVHRTTKVLPFPPCK